MNKANNTGEWEEIFDNAQTMHLQEFINHYSPSTETGQQGVEVIWGEPLRNNNRCNYELAVEEYFGLPETIQEKDEIKTDYGHLVNLVAMVCERNTSNKSQPQEGQDEKIEVVDGYTQIAIDRRTLPKDGQRVKFRTDKEDWYEGYFVEGDDIFQVTDLIWFFKWYIHEWKYI